MAYISKNGEKWRAQVQVTGFPRKSATFLTEAEARKWAADREAVLKRRRKVTNACASELASQMPVAYLDAMQKTDFTADEIVKNAFPLTITCGVYFLIQANRVVYVGQSIDVLARIAKHRRERNDFDSFNILPCSVDELDELEEAYIFALTPKYNSIYGAAGKRKRVPRGQPVAASNCAG